MAGLPPRLTSFGPLPTLLPPSGMSSTCPACGALIGALRGSCPGCGLPQTPTAERLAQRFAAPVAYTPPHLARRILASRSALEGEHRLVTVMFCDLADSTALATELGSEAMYELLNGFFEIALDQLHRFEGTINQFLGDGFMALFGAPLALEHHECDAVLAALALRQALNERASALLPQAPDSLRVRMGLNTGRV